MNDLKRRQFLNMLASAGAVTTFGGATSIIPSQAHAATFNDYKAMVVLFLHGGNDSFNMLLPTTASDASGRSYQAYSESRGDMAISNNPLGSLSGRTDDGSNPYSVLADGETATAVTDAKSYQHGVYEFNGVGLNGMMPELAQLIKDSKASVVANMGTLVEPVTKDDIINRTNKQFPPFLYAHNHQQRAMETGWADNLSAGGWAGRLADMWGIHQNGVNDGSPLGLNVSYGGATRLMTSSYNSPVVLQPGNEIVFRNGMPENNEELIFPTEMNSGFNLDVFKAFNVDRNDPPLRRVLKEASRRTANLANELTGIDITAFDGLEDPYRNPLFTNPSAEKLGLTRKLFGRALTAAKSAAFMVKLGSKLGLKRQVIYIDMGGFDNHSGLLTVHPLLLREISLAVWSFQQAVESVGLANNTTLFTMSDFGRTLGNNGDGTDHAWAGNNIVVGGDLKGGVMKGSMPDMRLGESSDTGTGNNAKGRMIPTIAVDQYLATMCKWFGVDDVGANGDGTDSDMAKLFPNLKNFRSSSTLDSAYLPDLFASTPTGADSLIQSLDLNLPGVTLPI